MPSEKCPRRLVSNLVSLPRTLAYLTTEDHEGLVADQNAKMNALLAPLDEVAYAAASVPSAEAIRNALRQGSEKLRKAVEQPKPMKVDPKIHFR